MFLYSGRNKDNVDFFELEPASWVNIKTGDEFEIEDYPFGTSANLISGIAKPERFLNSVSNLVLLVNINFSLIITISLKMTLNLISKELF